MSRSARFRAICLCIAFQLHGQEHTKEHGAAALIRDETHESQVFGETRHYRIFLPPDYETSGKRYSVIYWFHGFSERYNQPVTSRPNHNYDQGDDYDGDTIGRFVGGHDVIVVKWDGYNPRSAGESYPRPYNISPVETDRQFPLYFPELVAYIDDHYRTIADREHRATAGLSMGGFMSFWVAGKYPHLVSSASNFMGSSEFFVGPRGMAVEYRHEEMRGNYEGMRTRLVTGKRDFIRFYHARMGAIWNYLRAFHETADFDFDHGTPHMGETLAFHMRAFADPLPRPEVWNHVDVYPAFSVWGWDVESDRSQPGLTVLDQVSRTGFHSSVRHWIPDGRVMGNVKLRITSAPLYPPNHPQEITFIHMEDGRIQRSTQRADGEGRLHFALDGDEYQVGVGRSAILALGSFEILGAPWATDGQPVDIQVRVWNKSRSRSAQTTLQWSTPNPGVSIATPEVSLAAIPAGGSANVTLRFRVADPAREIVKLVAAVGGAMLPLEIPVFPAAPRAVDFRIADGREYTVFQKGAIRAALNLGHGNGDGKANAGETVAILLPDGDAWRAAELFSNDTCLDLRERVSDVWGTYDFVGASAKYSLPRIREGCPEGHVVSVLTRIQLPNAPDHRVVYAAVEFPVSGSDPSTKK